MKTLLQATLTFAGLTLFSIFANAAAVPWVGVLDKTQSITVPAGKILVIQHMCSGNEYTFYQFTVTGTAAGGIGSGAFSATLTYEVAPVGYPSLTSTTLPLGPGMVISTTSNLKFSVFGVAMDTSDYYASANPVIQKPFLTGTQMVAAVDSGTTVPTKTSATASTDLQNWSTNGVTISRSQSNPRISWISTPIDAPRKFLRATVTRTNSSALAD